jgi:hypothetical protein
MDDQQIRATLIDLVTNLDPDVEYELRHEEFVAEMPQSSERICGRDNMRAMQRAFPPDLTPTFRVRRITGAEDVWTVEASGDYGDEIYRVVAIFEFRAGKNIRETRYYPQPFEPPPWRSQCVERIADV